MKFDGSSGRKPSTEARRYVYAVTAIMLEAELEMPLREAQWLFGDTELDEFDRRRLRKEAAKVVAELRRKAAAP